MDEFKDTPEGEPEEKEIETKKRPGFGRGMFWGILIGITAVFAAVVVFAAVTGKAVTFTSSAGEESASDTLSNDKLAYLLAYLDLYYLYDLDDEDLSGYAAEGIMENLSDKYSAYYSPEEYEELISSSTGTFVGIGVYITYNDENQIYVYGMPDESPAKKTGILTGDIIVAVDGERDFDDIDELKAKVAGEEGTPVTITVLRGGEEIDYTIIRAVVDYEYVDYYMMDEENKIGYIILTSFTEASTDQFIDAVNALEAEGMESLIIDLRDNGGGEYNSVVEIADRLLPECTIFTTEDGDGTIVTESSSDEEYLDIPIVVLVNEYTASASELLTGALKDYGLATVVGTVTYGKGVVQTIFSLPDGSGIKFTTRMYFLPDGENIEDVGITPDIEVALPEGASDDGYITFAEDSQLEAAIDALGGDYDAVLNTHADSGD